MIPCGACAHHDVCIQGCSCALEAQTSVKIFQDMRAELVGANARHKLAAFGAAVLKLNRQDAGADIDGGTLQALAEEHGVLEQRTVTEPCCDTGCVCAEVDAIPGRCYFVPGDVLDHLKD